MVTWVETHGIEVVVIYYIFSAITGGMPTPVQTSGIAYRWIFSSINILNANFDRLIATQFWQSKVGMVLNAPQPVDNPTPTELAKAQGEQK